MGRRRHVVLMGPPGAGKGTQAGRLATEEGLCRISTGDLLRAAVQAGSELGRVAEGYMTRGELVPDELMLDLVAEELNRPACAAGAVYDGFPRTIEQARALDRILEERGEGVDQVIVIEVPEGELIRRMSGRRVCQNCGKLYHISLLSAGERAVCEGCGGPLVQRADDRPETIQRRLSVHRQETEPVLAYYNERTGVSAVRGDREIDDVAAAIRRLVTVESGA
ncbi:MAG: adenylate kinase [Gemmatimonadota bacterium]